MQFSKYIRVLTSCHVLVDKVKRTAPCAGLLHTAPMHGRGVYTCDEHKEHLHRRLLMQFYVLVAISDHCPTGSYNFSVQLQFFSSATYKSQSY